MKNAKGFTLIELLIVIAIIGILAAVLIPQLLGARNAAQNAAAQAHSGNVYTSVVGELSSNPSQGVPEVVAAYPSCATALQTASGYGWNDPGNAVESCVISEGAGGDFEVTATSRAGGVYVNGQAQAAAATP